MRTINTLLLVGATALGFSLIPAKAGEPFLSPRAAQQRHESRTVTSPDTGPNLVSHSYLGAAAKWELNRPRVGPAGTTTPNLVSGNYPGAHAKNPNYRLRQFEIAPLVSPNK